VPNTSDTAHALERLAGLDQFHTGGMESTRALAERAAITAVDQVLDVGGGLGGSARLLAHECGCHVTVLDLIEDYCRAGERLTAWAELNEQIRFQHGDALALPYGDAAFDVVWTQHSSMNIADKVRLYAEAYRVLRPGGRLALYEVVAGSVVPPHFPVLWARTSENSFLVTQDVLRATLAQTGFGELSWQDTSTWALGWLEARQQALTPGGAAQRTGLPLVLGPEFSTMAQNHRRNLREGRICIIEAVFRRW
jgi:SAM-dependent methyltransferase